MNHEMNLNLGLSKQNILNISTKTQMYWVFFHLIGGNALQIGMSIQQ